MRVDKTRGLLLDPGERWYIGYHQWVVTPEEAWKIRERGYQDINGMRFPACGIMQGNGEWLAINGWPVIQVDIPTDASHPQLLLPDPAEYEEIAA